MKTVVRTVVPVLVFLLGAALTQYFRQLGAANLVLWFYYLIVCFAVMGANYVMKLVFGSEADRTKLTNV